MNLMTSSKNFWQELTARLNAAESFVPQLFLRLILFWEFWEAGKMKWDSGAEGNWFASIHDSFPFPFNSIDPSISWTMATFGEVVFSVLILIGLFTRFVAISLIVLTVVATAAVHWPENWNSLSELWNGYAITNKGAGNFKLPLLYVIMLLPLVFGGAGKLSLDNLLARFVGTNGEQEKNSDLGMWGLIFLVIGVAVVFVMPYWGIGLCVAGFVALIANRFLTP